MIKFKTNIIESFDYNVNLTFKLRTLYQKADISSESSSQQWPWLNNINWFLAIAEFKKIAKFKDANFYVLEIWYDDKNCVAYPLNCSDDHRFWYGLSCFYSPSYDGIYCNDSEIGNSWRYLLQALSFVQPNWVSLELHPIAQNNMQDAEEIKYSDVIKYSYNWKAFFENQKEYWHKRPSQLKNTIKRKKSKLAKYDFSIKVYRKVTAELMANYWAIYNKSWKQPERDEYFINWLVKYASKQGILRLGFLCIDNQPVAVQLWLVLNAKAAIYKLAQDKAFDSLSPGTLLMAEMTDIVINDDNVDEIDFLTGDDAYKALWMDKSEALYKVCFYNPDSLFSLILWLKKRIKRAIKSILKSDFKVKREYNDIKG